ncbi:MAG: SGNH/GDSL hydrolase family protein [Lentisphaeria bacterium]|nr:SGNH/GDSL hydrolase family protein [Lentisphaeria bacterium]
MKRNRARASYKKYNCPVVNLSLLMRDEMEKYLCGDGIHLRKEGHKLFTEKLFKVMEELLLKNGHSSNIDLTDNRQYK